MSFEKRSLLITVEQLYSKAANLLANKLLWFSIPVEEYTKKIVHQLKQLIANSKNLFLSNKLFRTKNRNITGFFGKNNPLSNKTITTGNSEMDTNNFPDNHNITTMQINYENREKGKFSMNQSENINNRNIHHEFDRNYDTNTEVFKITHR